MKPVRALIVSTLNAWKTAHLSPPLSDEGMTFDTFIIDYNLAALVAQAISPPPDIPGNFNLGTGPAGAGELSLERHLNGDSYALVIRDFGDGLWINQTGNGSTPATLYAYRMADTDNQVVIAYEKLPTPIHKDSAGRYFYLPFPSFTFPDTMWG